MYITRKARKVAAAIALLDRRGPEDWRERVNLEKLDLGSAFTCVLAQVYEPEQRAGAYMHGLRQLGIEDSTVFDSNEYRQEWRRQITKGEGKR